MNKQIEQLEKLYRDSCESGLLPDVWDKSSGTGGLCNVMEAVLGNKYKKMFVRMCFGNVSPAGFWGHSENFRELPIDDAAFQFTPLRQTLLLLFIEWLKTDSNE